MTEGESETAQNNDQHIPSSERLIYVVLVDDNYAPDQDAQIHVCILGNYFSIVIEVTCQDRVRLSYNQQQQPTLFHYLNISSTFFSSMTIKIHIITLKPICLSSKPPL